LLSRPDGENKKKRSRKEGAGFLYSLCQSLDQNSPAPRTRAASHQEKTPTQQLIMRQKIQCGGDRVPLAASINSFFFLQIAAAGAGLCFKHSESKIHFFMPLFLLAAAGE
jgi:hypothetical protein